jgi:uncharacterized protein with FMN-binding domain
MKKLLLSLALIFSFTGYNLVFRKNQTVSQASVTDPFPVSSPPPVSYKDGTYTGDVKDVFYGNVQVGVVVTGGRISDVRFLQYPNDRRTSVEINSRAMPLLQSEAVQAQTAGVDIISGATATSQGFIESLSSALNKAV